MSPSTVTTSPQWKRPSRTPPSSTARRRRAHPKARDSLPPKGRDQGDARCCPARRRRRRRQDRLLHRSVLRDLREARRPAPRARGDHCRHARLHHPYPSANDSPTDASMWHRRAARRHGGSRHGDGGLRPLVAVYSTFTRAIDQVNLDVGLHGLPGSSAPTAPVSPAPTAQVITVLDLVLSRGPGMTVFACRATRNSRCSRRHGHHDRPGRDPLVTERPPIRARRRRLWPSARKIRAGDAVPPSASDRCFPQPRRRRSSPPKASTPPSTTRGQPARPCHDRRHRRSRLCRLNRGRAPHGWCRCRGARRSANAAPRAEFECSVPTEYIPHDDPDAIHARFGLTARARRQRARPALIVPARQAGGLRCSRGSPCS